MNRKKKIIVANWKMNPPSSAEARLLFNRTKLTGSRLDKVLTVICPPFPYLGIFAKSGTLRVSLGAQDVFYANTGRATGEVSPEMLRDLGVSYVIVGHSERRGMGETDEIVSKKIKAALLEGLCPIVCVGEKERDLEGKYYDVLKTQIAATFSGIARAQFNNVYIAYEPLWAIGKSARESMEPRVVREMEIFIRKTLKDLFDEQTAQSPAILYGGSVEERNMAQILEEGGVSGLLVGHKSLEIDEFIRMLKIANGANRF